MAASGVTPMPPHRRRARPAMIGAGIAVTAAAAAAAVLMATSGTGAPAAHHVAGRGAGHPAGSAVTAVSARHILLTAARQTAHAAASAGRYWLVKEIDASSVAVGPRGDRYMITMGDSYTQWTARSATGTSWFVGRSLGARPATPADVAAWQRDGSPSRWAVALHKGGGVAQMVVTAKPGHLFGNQSNTGDKVFAIGGSNVTMAQIRALPTSTARLRALLLRAFAAPGGAGGDLPTGATDWLWQVGTSMITDMPLTPGTSAADYRMLAGLPGVRSLGMVRDAAGRAGLAVQRSSASPEAGGEESRLIVNPATGQPLALEYLVVRPAGMTLGLPRGAVASYQLIKFAGWSDSKPVRLNRG
jgi:hypothetical protein